MTPETAKIIACNTQKRVRLTLANFCRTGLINSWQDLHAAEADHAEETFDAVVTADHQPALMMGQVKGRHSLASAIAVQNSDHLGSASDTVHGAVQSSQSP